MKKVINKQETKLIAGKCAICGIDEYKLLDVHRLEHGKLYSRQNTIVICTLCHRKHHAGLIKIDRWYESTSGRKIRWFDENGIEHFT